MYSEQSRLSALEFQSGYMEELDEYGLDDFAEQEDEKEETDASTTDAASGQ